MAVDVNGPASPGGPRAAAEAMPILRLSLPIVAGLAASTLIGVVDTVMIAPLGTVPLAAASLTTAVIIIFYSALYGFLSATGVEAAHRHGAGDEDGVARALRAGLTLALGAGGLGAMVMAGVFLLLPAIGQPGEVLAIMGPYWLAMSGLLIPVALLMAISQVLNAIDRPWTAAGFAFAGRDPERAAELHADLGVGGWEGLGLLGAGLASVIADGVALGWRWLWLARSGLLVRRARAPGLTRRLARDGLPLAIGYTGEGAAYAVVGLMLGLFGAVALAANQIVQAVGGVLYMLPLGMSAATAIRVGQAIGAGERARLRPVATAAMALVSGWMVLVTVALVLFGGPLAAALSDDPEVVALATAMFVAVALIQVADGIQSTALGALRGVHGLPMAHDVHAGVLLAAWRCPSPRCWASAPGLGPLGVWAGYGAGIVLAAVVLPLRFWRLTR
jgi:multidrug resistance protein, MATE family